jgi:AAHS family benzoate transporter-like MFS transporter
MTFSKTTDQDTRRKRTVVWGVALVTTGMVFDGFDLVTYGAVVPTFLKDPSQIGEVTPAVAGTLGSYALLGMLFGALLAGAFGDIIGRRQVMLTAYAWFSVGMAVTAFIASTTTFGIFRFVTGLGMGALIATTGALVAEIAPPGKKNLCSAISYCGVPLGSLIGSFLAIVLLDSIGWRGLFLIGALPLVTLLPLAFFKLPESVPWLVAKGQLDKARAVSERTGLPNGVSGPLLGGFVLAADLGVDSIFYILTGLAVVGVILTLLVPRAHREDTSAIEATVPDRSGSSLSSPTK